MNKTEVRITGLEANVENVDRISKKNKIRKGTEWEQPSQAHIYECLVPPAGGTF